MASINQLILFINIHAARGDDEKRGKNEKAPGLDLCSPQFQYDLNIIL